MGLEMDTESWSSFSCLFSSLWSPLSVTLQPTCPQPCDSELDWGILSEPREEARPTISWPHSRWLDSCRPRPVVSIGSAHEAMAARRQQQQYTERARYTDDSNITWRMKPVGNQKWSTISCVVTALNGKTEWCYLCNKRCNEGTNSGHPTACSQT